MKNLLRERDSIDDSKVGTEELYFDLVFVFGVTQLSRTLIEHPTPVGMLQTGMLFLGLWWVWIFTTWVTNWLDPSRTVVRLLLFVLMLASLFMSMAIPEAFGPRAVVFAVAYVLAQVGRSLFMAVALKGHDDDNRRNFQRITVWLTVSGVFWLAGALAPDVTWQMAAWACALAIEYLGPSAGFAVPGLGRSETAQWDIDGYHIAERAGLFIIIALGESIMETGMAFMHQPWDRTAVAGLGAAFVGSIAQWWLYFDIHAEEAARKTDRSADPGRIARLVYTYIHVFIVGGIIVSAAADEMVLKHPTGPVEPATVAAILGGNAVFLAGNVAFKRAIWRCWAPSHFAGLVALAVLWFFAEHFDALRLTLATVAVLLVVAVWDARSASRIVHARRDDDPADPTRPTPNDDEHESSRTA